MKKINFPENIFFRINKMLVAPQQLHISADATDGSRPTTGLSHQLLAKLPVFTTPTADFVVHSQELKTLVDEVYRLKDAYFTMFPPMELQRLDFLRVKYNSHQAESTSSSGRNSPSAPMQGDWLLMARLDKVALHEQKTKYLESLIGRVIERLNLLTKPPVKKKKKKKPMAAVVPETVLKAYPVEDLPAAGLSLSWNFSNLLFLCR